MVFFNGVYGNFMNFVIILINVILLIIIGFGVVIVFLFGFFNIGVEG